MEFLALVGIGLVGPFFWVISAEASAVVYGAKMGWDPALVALTLCGAQSGAFTACHVGGDRLLARWAWFRDVVDKTRQRFGHRLQQSYLWLAVPAGIFGVPPAVGLAALAGRFEVPFGRLLLILATGRWIRFFLLARGGALGIQLTAGGA